MLYAEIERYLYEVLGLQVLISPWKEGAKLPFYLQDAYEFAAVELLGASYVLLLARDGGSTASELRKRMETLDRLTGAVGVYVISALNSHERKRLIEQHVPFIVPGNQLYLPDLGVDLREYFRRRRQSPDKTLSPATQALLIRALLQPWQGEIHPAELGERLSYTAMTLSRAGKELEAAGLVQAVGKGRSRWLRFHVDNPREVWQAALPLLRDPVKKRFWVSPECLAQGPFLLAGESALALMTLLADPLNPVYAISAEQWKLMQQEGIQELPGREPGALQLQIWRYSPEIYEAGDAVDPLSLILSLQGEHDDRVRQAVEELEEQLPW
ncbi:hypothetical protein KRX52_20205 [Pseudomonas sp. MAP12]|uniref:HTH marR-type domain-containing protein n=1 Tax=Geopseudomonas aromaticivorans TaxID=2849492 RepID=A0ABS6N221_9GAMM|nr:hypothetical protein [Pseudomonas aromaticivorans]MBV2135100.1 hypothetical protein [Pseudomonas aromaticivorans]